MTPALPGTAAIGVQADFTSPKYSDLTVCCGRDRYLLHRAIVCPRSKFFDATCDRGFKEASTATITLDDEDLATVNRLFIYLYTYNYPEGAIPSSQQPERAIPPLQPSATAYEPSKSPHLRGPVPSNTAMPAGPMPSKIAMPAESAPLSSQMMSNVLVYAIADKYDLPGLKALAKERVQGLANTTSAYTETADLAQVAKFIFESIPAGDCGLRDTVIDLCSRHIDEIVKDSAMTDMIRKIGSLSFGIMLRTRESDKLALERAKTSEAVIQVKLAHSKAENSGTVERMLVQEKEMKAAIASKNVANVELKKTIGQRDSAVAQRKQVEVERNVAHIRLDEAVRAQKLALNQKEFAINQRKQVAVERDAALNQKCDCLVRLGQFLDQAGGWDNCRNVACGAKFASYLELFGAGGPNFKMQLRCWHCNCRHDIGAGVGS